jgi:hypothetical protein
MVYVEFVFSKICFTFICCICVAACFYVTCLHCVQTDPAKNVWTRAYLIPERNQTVRRQEEGKNSVYVFIFCMNLGEINALLTISCCQMKHFGYVIVY